MCDLDFSLQVASKPIRSALLFRWPHVYVTLPHRKTAQSLTFPFIWTGCRAGICGTSSADLLLSVGKCDNEDRLDGCCMT